MILLSRTAGIAARTALRVLARDGDDCFLCAAPLERGAGYAIEQRHPAHGDRLSNLLAVCLDCQPRINPGPLRGLDPDARPQGWRIDRDDDPARTAISLADLGAIGQHRWVTLTDGGAIIGTHPATCMTCGISLTWHGDGCWRDDREPLCRFLYPVDGAAAFLPDRDGWAVHVHTTDGYETRPMDSPAAAHTYATALNTMAAELYTRPGDARLSVHILPPRKAGP